MENKMYVVLGDWSADGHSMSKKVLVRANKTVQEMQEAYKASCRTLGISFNHNEDYTGLPSTDYATARARQICTEYEESTMPQHCAKVLQEAGCPLIDSEFLGDGRNVDEELFVGLLMWFIGYSLQGLEWSLPQEKDSTPCLNGYWDNNLNVQFGYGLFND